MAEAKTASYNLDEASKLYYVLNHEAFQFTLHV